MKLLSKFNRGDFPLFPEAVSVLRFTAISFLVQLEIFPMYFDRFDICEAYYLALTHCHGGQWSDEYRRLCKMQTYFKPRSSLSQETLTTNAREIYNTVCFRLLNQGE